MIADLTCFGCYASENQFIDGMVYGFLIINIIVVMAICIRVDIHPKVRLCISGIGMFVFFVITILIVADLIKYQGSSSDWLDIAREVVAFCASAVLCVVYVFDFVLNVKRIGG